MARSSESLSAFDGEGAATDEGVALARLLTVLGASYEQRAQLEGALRSRVVIEQAKGVLAERLRLSIDEAFALLRAAARSKQMRIHDLAAEVIRERRTPPAILDTLRAAREKARR